MLLRFFGPAFIAVFIWTNGHRNAAAQATPSANSNAATTFARLPLVQPSHEPVEIEGLVLDGRLLHLDEPLHLPPDWPAHLSILLRNVSSQPITYVMLNMNFPESGTASTPPFGYQVHLGNLIPAQAKNQLGELVTREQLAPLLWLPNVEVTIPLLAISDSLAAASHVYQPISRVIVLPPRVQFQDVSLWDGGYHRCRQDGSHCIDASYADFLPR